MSFADRVSAGPPHKRIPVCSVKRVFSRLDDRDKEALAGMMEDENWANSMIVKEIMQDFPDAFTSHETGAKAVSRHRRGFCGCARG